MHLNHLLSWTLGAAAPVALVIWTLKRFRWLRVLSGLAAFGPWCVFATWLQSEQDLEPHAFIEALLGGGLACLGWVVLFEIQRRDRELLGEQTRGAVRARTAEARSVMAGLGKYDAPR